MTRRRLISFEGGEGVGKTTQIEVLAARLRGQGSQVLVTREPGGTPLGEALRPLLKHAPEGRNMCAETELLLFLACRAQLVREVIVPTLARGDWVLCDRYSDSTLVYQGAGRGLPAEWLKQLNAFAVESCTPGLTLLLELAHERAQARRRQRDVAPDRLEGEPDDFHARVAAGYQALAARDPDRVRAIAAEGKPEEIAAEIWRVVASLYNLKAEPVA